jgi:hypothetical protein
MTRHNSIGFKGVGSRVLLAGFLPAGDLVAGAA